MKMKVTISERMMLSNLSEMLSLMQRRVNKPNQTKPNQNLHSRNSQVETKESNIKSASLIKSDPIYNFNKRGKRKADQQHLSIPMNYGLAFLPIALLCLAFISTVRWYLSNNLIRIEYKATDHPSQNFQSSPINPSIQTAAETYRTEFRSTLNAVLRQESRRKLTNMEPEIPIDLSLRQLTPSSSPKSTHGSPQIVKPIPKPPWAIVWYQNLFPAFGNIGNSYSQLAPTTSLVRNNTQVHSHNQNQAIKQQLNCFNVSTFIKSKADNQILGINSQNLQKQDLVKLTKDQDDLRECELIKNRITSSTETKLENVPENNDILSKSKHSPVTIVDIATCDGPVLFDRVLNPNFAVTVEHHNTKSSNCGSPNSGTLSNPRSNSYLCICCNQTFKSFFCYQKHKKRHLNPVTVDITSTSTNKNLPCVTVSENKSQIKDMNTQSFNRIFFPCRNCGNKYPSYYFVHKHKKVCHQSCA